MICTTVVYPNEPDSRFDRSYYLERHMPLVNRRWSPFGLKEAQIIDGRPGLDGSKPACHMMVNLYWDSIESVQRALAETGPEIMGDIPNYTNLQPIIYVGEVVGQ